MLLVIAALLAAAAPADDQPAKPQIVADATQSLTAGC
jgi:hypothetical protein